MSPTLRCVVEGRVQRVAFRYYTRDAAQRLGLVGFVRNLPDGRVEAVARGPLAALEDFRCFLEQGSPLSLVEEVLCEELDTEEAFSSFDIRR